MSARTIIVGDIHGCLDEFKALLNKVAFNVDSDRLILTGDLISKGPFPYETLVYARSLKCDIVMGNHERAFLLYLQGKKYAYSGFVELENRIQHERSQWIKWLEGLPLYIETPEFIVVHAGLHPQQHPKITDPKILTTIRTWDGKGETLNNPYDPAWFDLYKKEKLIIFGHWAKLGLVEKNNVIGLDSGCVYGNALSALILPTRKIVQIKAKKAYQALPNITKKTV